ncbi:MAG TPA: DUF3089 domain-containing protein [Tepidiformaceae bacterium]|nr:DUF3089 domain-containing protein [Tepidiformaceae bacterium]
MRIGGLAVGAALLAMLVAGCSGGKAAPAVSTMVAPSAGASVPLGAATARPTATTPPPAASASASSPVAPVATLPAGVQPVDYTSAANWLCRPGKADTPCTEDLDSTAVGSDGSKVQPFVAAAKPPIDCFYVYPTASSDPGDNSDLVTGAGEERAAVNQAARFASVCRVFAPVYRQVTLTALGDGHFGDAKAQAIAYADVVDAWEEYLAHDNGGRGVVLIGHSQGAMQLKKLIHDEIDSNARARALLVSAILLGGNVAQDEYQNVPPCATPDQLGCMVGYSSFLASAPPPANSLFGRGNVLCVDPAALLHRSPALDSYFPTAGNVLAGSVTTPFLEYTGLTGECVQKDGFSYLSVTAPAGLAFPGAAVTAPGPAWGLHIIDSNLTLGDQIALVAEESAAFAKR